MLIKNWKELSQIPNESPTHRLEINVNIGYAWLYAKNKKDFTNKLSFMRQIHHQDVYLSTHTFYGEMHRRSTKILKACGFNVEIDNWDKDK